MRAIDVVRKIATRAQPAYVEALDKYADDLFATYSLTTNLRLSHFLARCLSETGGFRVLVESAGYTAKNLSDQWDRGNWHRYFRSKSELVALAGQGEKLFNIVYGNRMGNGGPETGDGYRYRGRGPLQTTGKGAYAEYGKRMGVDLVSNPDALLEPQNILLPSLYEWSDGNLNAYADKNDALSIARIINVGTVKTSQIPNGYQDQLEWLGYVKRALAAGAAAA
ncbi:glycoside hydrolase family 19 protein [Roseixanthobacter pseudopolyaromaticivorans]|uniref:glycoside hydrolase family 19 protein n=1 Tax=Xanthobacteraceae TaxID=335928 RepID=UPI00372A2473